MPDASTRFRSLRLPEGRNPRAIALAQSLRAEAGSDEALVGALLLFDQGGLVTARAMAWGVIVGGVIQLATLVAACGGDPSGVEHLTALRQGGTVEVPTYDFATHTRRPLTESVHPTPVVIVDGLLVLAEPGLRDHMDLKVFVDTDPDLRLARRLERDLTERGRTPTEDPQELGEPFDYSAPKYWAAFVLIGS
mgnify:CR=1 FL=1